MSDIYVICIHSYYVNIKCSITIFSKSKKQSFITTLCQKLHFRTNLCDVVVPLRTVTKHFKVHLVDIVELLHRI